MKIKKNSIQCKQCGDIIESKHRHDFVWCKCGEVAADGGHDYLRRVAKNQDAYIELSETDDNENESKAQ